MKCRIQSVGKRRDGGTRFWCLEHHADATAKYGRRASSCRYAQVEPILRSQVFALDLDAYQGGVAIWGAVPPVYDTTLMPLDRGIHIHARFKKGGLKDIDSTYRKVVVKTPRVEQPKFVITELDAIYYMVSSVFGFQTKFIKCTLCDYPHLDKDWFSVHEHRRHLCSGCGRQFSDDKLSVGNPISLLQELIGARRHRVVRAKRSIKLRQKDFPGGIQIWGSNPALLWTGSAPEENGIHLHAFKSGENHPAEDDTFHRVVIDGHELNPSMVRTLMAQSALPHLARRVVSVSCMTCKAQFFDQGQNAFTPQIFRSCPKCKSDVRSRSRLKKVISNPLLELLDRLALKAVRKPQNHDMGLLPESL